MAKFTTPATEESVACNLIPMIDIMFLLLLFFMLGADMTQREMADVVLPLADQAKEDDANKVKGGTPRLTVNVYHRRATASFACAQAASNAVCRDMDHWLIDIRGHEYTKETLKPKLKAEADREREAPGVAGGKPLSGRKVMVRADHLAPFGFIQRVIEACAEAGLYKIEVGAAQPPPS